uniref:Homeodomain-like protein n=1 Tax=Tanacetum cinerariifolium TaxID=118510 RepID=A0A699L5N8_TANCI|nr:homeodomain-like protein [Tanacetum cinerariifolium]
MKNANPPPTRPVIPTAIHARFKQELQELLKILALVDSRLENTPLVSPFPHSDNDSDDEEVLNELSEYENAKTLRRERIINSSDGDDLAFQCMIGFRKFTAYLDPFLPMNIILRKAYNTIMVDRLEGTRKNLVAIVRDVCVLVGSFTYITDFVVFEDIGGFIISDMAEVLMGRPFTKITKLIYDVTKGLVSFTKIFDTYTYRMPRTIPRLKNFNWSKVPPLLELRQNDLMNGFRHPYEKNKFIYKYCLNLGPEYQVNESMKEWLINGHISIHETTWRRVTSSLATRLINKEKRFLGGNTIYFSRILGLSCAF